MLGRPKIIPKKGLLDDINFSAIGHELETHPEARTLKQFHEDLAEIVDEIRQYFSLHNQKADDDAGFKQAADVIKNDLLPNDLLRIGQQLESTEPLTLKKLEQQRLDLMDKIGENGLISITGEASKMLAESFIEFLKAFNNKEYWPDKNCRTDIGGIKLFSIFNQGFPSIYIKDFPDLLVRKNAAILELKKRIEDYNDSVREQKKLNL